MIEECDEHAGASAFARHRIWMCRACVSIYWSMISLIAPFMTVYCAFRRSFSVIMCMSAMYRASSTRHYEFSEYEGQIYNVGLSNAIYPNLSFASTSKSRFQTLPLWKRSWQRSDSAITLFPTINRSNRICYINNLDQGMRNRQRLYHAQNSRYGNV